MNANNDAKKKLVDELQKCKEYNDNGSKSYDTDLLVNFIIERERKIVEPLEKLRLDDGTIACNFEALDTAIYETLKRAGLNS